MTPSKVGSRPRARRREPVDHEPLIGPTVVDYADSFEIDVPEQETRSLEELFRGALDNAPVLARLTPLVHRCVLRFSLGPSGSRDHIFGWKIAQSDTDVVRLQAEGSLIRGMIVVRRTSPTTISLTTFVGYSKRTAARIVWAIIGPLHRRVAPYLLERGVDTARQTRG